MKSKLLCGLISGVLIASVVLSGCLVASAENTYGTTIVMTIDDPVMSINGDEVNIDNEGTAPVIADGRTLVPIRAVVEALGGSVEWNSSSQTVTIAKENTVVQLSIDETTARVNDSSVTLDAPPVIMNGRTMIPLRFVAESLGADVKWDSEKREISITANDEGSAEITTEFPVEEEAAVSDGKNLIVYFTMPESDGVDTVAGASRVVVDGELYGNVEFMADVVEETVGGDKVEIKAVQEYPTLHEPLVDLADEELAENARPELATHIDNIDDYDTIYIGYPIWWGDMPMPLYTFFDEYDFGGKTIIPFSSHGGSGLAGTVREIRELEPDAVVEDGYTVSRDDIADDAENIAEEFAAWLNGNK